MKSAVCYALALTLLASLGCGQGEIESLKAENSTLSQENQDLEAQVENLKGQVAVLSSSKESLDFLAAQLKNVKARIVTNMGDIELEFFADKAPIHCFSFVTRAESGFYDNTKFHRVMKNFMLQGGDPLSKDNNPSNDGTGGPIVNIPHEFNTTKHTPGILSMARVGDVSVGAGCQFFIMHGTATHLDGQYTAFGKVTEGIEVVNKIANTQTDGERPVKPVVIKTIKVYK